MTSTTNDVEWTLRRYILGLGAVFVVFVALAAGVTKLGPPAGDEVFLPEGNAVAEASAALVKLFPTTAQTATNVVIFVGDVTTPEGLGQIDDVMDNVLDTEGVDDRLLPDREPVSAATLVSGAAGGAEPESLSQQQVDTIIAAIRADERGAKAWPQLVSETKIDGKGVAIGIVPLFSGALQGQSADAASSQFESLQLELAERADSIGGPLDVRALSNQTVAEEKQTSNESSMNKLLALAFVMIAIALLAFFRSGLDVFLSLVGLVLTVAGTLGFQGWIGPKGFDLIGLPNQLTNTAPIMLISLCVDYAVKMVESYREYRRGGATRVRAAGRQGILAVIAPIALAASVTIVSLLTNVVSPIPANRDFGWVAAFGVLWGIAVFLVVPVSLRVLRDARREAAGTLGAPREISDAIPGSAKATAMIGRVVSRRPGIVLAVITGISVVMGIAVTKIDTTFSSRDFLPNGGESRRDLELMDTAFGGQQETVNVLVRAELTDDRVLRNVLGLHEAFESDETRPAGATSEITLSLGTLLRDWVVDNGGGDANYDPELGEMLTSVDQGLKVDPTAVQRILDRLEELDPDGFASVAVVDPSGIDSTLLQFNAVTGDQQRTRQMVEDLEGLWFGADSQMTASSGEIVGLEITDAITDSSTQGFVSAIVIALFLLVAVYGIQRFRPMLGFIAVAPVALVLLWVLGTMSLVGIPYNVVTSLIAALSMGIGIDYSIHMIHRFEEAHAEIPDIRAAIVHTMRSGGGAVIASGLTTACGFIVLVFSPLTPFVQFGVVTAMTIVYSVLAALVLVPPMLTVWAAYHEWRAVALRAVARGS